MENFEDKFKHEIAKQILKVVPHLKHEQAFELVGTAAKKGWEYVIQIARINKFQKLSEKPEALAQKWVKELETNEWITAYEVGGPLIFVAINKNLLAQEVITTVVKMGEKYGTSNEGEGKTVVVEFSSPNIAKPFHAGHLRSTIIGNFLYNVHRTLGYNVVGINYLGDWGKQYGLLAVGFEKYGNEEELQKNPIRHLFNVYVAINKYADGNPEQNIEPHPEIQDQARHLFKQMELGDEKALALWKKFRDLSIEEYKKVYARLNTHFDVYSGESLQTEGMNKQMKALVEKNLLKDDNGAKLIDLKDYKLNVALIQKSDGATLYFTRDIAAAVDRWEKYHFHKMFYVVASQQNLHFQQLFKVLELMGYDWSKRCTHINFGLVKGMSTRKGNVVFLEEILQEANQHMRSIMEENKEKFEEIEDPDKVADIIGLSAVYIQDMQAGRLKDYEFNWERMTRSQGHTGPYLQFAHARLCGVERKSGVNINPSANLKLLTEEAALDLAIVIARYPEALARAAQQVEPSTLVSYLFDLSHAISVAHNSLWVKGQQQDVAEARMLLYHAARITLGNGMRILGLQPLERM